MQLSTGECIWQSLIESKFVDRKTGICGLFGTQVLPSAEKGVQVVISAFEKYLYSVAACQKQEI